MQDTWPSRWPAQNLQGQTRSATPNGCLLFLALALLGCSLLFGSLFYFKRVCDAQMTARCWQHRQAFGVRPVLRHRQPALNYRYGARNFVPRKVALDAVNLECTGVGALRRRWAEQNILYGTSDISSNRLLSAAELGLIRELKRALALNGRCFSSRTCALDISATAESRQHAAASQP